MEVLSKLFRGVAAKRLSAVEVNPKASNQHEFQGTKDMREIFGTEDKKIPCTFLYLGDYEDQTVSSVGSLTWYDSRRDQPKRSAEFRNYYPGNIVTEHANEGDLLVIAQKQDGSILAIVVKQGSTLEHQVLWLFGISVESGRFVFSTISGAKDRPVNFAERVILESLGIDVETPIKENWIDLIIKKFNSGFPSTRLFSLFARDTLKDISSRDDPDNALISWINHEEMLFKTLEHSIVNHKLKKGFENVEDFISFSLSVQNRRKSRMGFALENHLEQIFTDHKIQFSREKITENKSKPDFIFPSIESYSNKLFPENNLTMLGAKSTCKDRWRQVLSEAQRIPNKHLLTLEPGISENQTHEMRGQNLQLVLPESLHETYSKDQQKWLINLSEFIDLISHRQKIKTS